MTVSHRPRAWLLGLLLALLLIVAGDTMAWWWIVGRLEDEAASWRTARVAEGFAVRSGAAVRGGWPFLATLTLPDVAFASDAVEATAAASWHADGLKLVFDPLDPHAVSLVPLGTQTLRLGGGTPVTLTAQRLDVRVKLDGGQAAGVRVEGAGLSLPVGRSALTIGRVTGWVEGTGLDIAAGQIGLPGQGLPFGGALDRLEVLLRSSIPVPPLRDPAAAAAAWQRAGGRAVIETAAMRWGPLDASGSGTLMLDAALQPAGSAALRLSGYSEVLEAMVRAGTISRNESRVAAAVLGLMSRPTPSGSPEAEVPLTLADGTVKMGAMPLARVPAITWP